MRARWWTVPLSSALGAAGCGEGGGEPEPPDAQSEYVDLYLDEGIEACAGQLAGIALETLGPTSAPVSRPMRRPYRRHPRVFAGLKQGRPDATQDLGDPGALAQLA